MRVVLSAQARAGLQSVALFIARDNRARARSFVQELRAKALEIGAMPHGSPLLEHYEDRGIRRRVYRDSLIFYRVDGDAIFMVHSLHGAQDYGALLFPEAMQDQAEP